LKNKDNLTVVVGKVTLQDCESNLLTLPKFVAAFAKEIVTGTVGLQVGVGLAAQNIFFFMLYCY